MEPESPGLSPRVEGSQAITLFIVVTTNFCSYIYSTTGNIAHKSEVKDMTKYYIFPNGTLKITGKALAEVVHPDNLSLFREVTRIELCRINTVESSKLAVDKVKNLCEITKKKAINVRDALKK